ncbi:SPC3 (YLR066W) [Zygosaccharomyces parabailii]|nr:SPC3 (YLR066W) [Zygosaccharomyces parabailii]CDH09622.1 probable Signal peptidase complex subunit SPC3 [Zygosaccharomyces bailii ISA1307]
MFSLSQRVQALSNQAITFGLIISAFVILTSYLQLDQQDAFLTPATFEISNATVSTRTSRYYGSVNGKPKENAKLSFDLDTDLSPLFTWNTKQVFVYLTAAYNGSKNPLQRSQVTFWDKIVPTKEEAHLQLHNVKSKYAVWDIEDKISGRELLFKLQWNIQPWIGPLMYGETVGNTTFVIPESNDQK